MRVNFGQLLDSMNTGALNEFTSDKFISIATAVRLKKVKKAAIAELEDFEEERLALVKKYGTWSDEAQDHLFQKPKKDANGVPVKDKDGNPVLIRDQAAADKFSKGYKELRKVEVDIPGEMIPMSAFEPRPVGAPPLPFSADNMLYLDWLLIEPEEDALDAATVETKEANA